MKSSVYSWRLSPQTKSSLEGLARRRGVTLAGLLDGMVQDLLGAADAPDGVDQARRREGARKAIGAIAGGDPRRAERARLALRSRLETRHGHGRG